jgi:hypothetical protein
LESLDITYDVDNYFYKVSMNKNITMREEAGIRASPTFLAVPGTGSSD